MRRRATQDDENKVNSPPPNFDDGEDDGEIDWNWLEEGFEHIFGTLEKIQQQLMDEIENE